MDNGDTFYLAIIAVIFLGFFCNHFHFAFMNLYSELFAIRNF